MKESKLIPAPIDNKNIMEDWIEDVFDEQSALIHKGRFIGFVNGLPFYCRPRHPQSNYLEWFLINGGMGEDADAKRNAIAELKRRLQSIDKDNEENRLEVHYYDVALLGLYQSFYFVQD